MQKLWKVKKVNVWNIDKFTVSLPNTMIYFIATQLHVLVHYRSTIRLSNKNFLKKINVHTNYKLYLFL
jgi:hypothetical protein